jgi:hypothetical protein
MRPCLLCAVRRRERMMSVRACACEVAAVRACGHTCARAAAAAAARGSRRADQVAGGLQHCTPFVCPEGSEDCPLQRG